MEKDSQTHIGHRERLRKEILSQNIENIQEHKFLELLLTYSIPYKDVNPLAHNLLNEFGSLIGVFNAPLEDLKKVKGVGERTAVYLKILNLIPEICSLKKNCKSKTILKTPNDTVRYLQRTAKFGKGEQFSFLCLSEDGELLYSKRIGSEKNFYMLVNKIDVLKGLIKPNVHSIVISHTHPLGMPQPSKDDVSFTKDLYYVLKSIGLRLCDHIILGVNSYFSFFKNKLLFDNEDFDSDSKTLKIKELGISIQPLDE